MRIRYSAAADGRPQKKAFVYTKGEHLIEKKDVDSDALRIVERLRSSGHETYIVGGAVRDLMVGTKPKDFDIVTEASPARIKRVFRNSRIIGRRFRLVHVFFGPKIFEVSTFRSLKDGTTSNTYGSVEEDVLRRDFTFNALLYDPEEEVVVDYVGGFADIKAKRLKPVIPLSIIFKDDPVRMLRAAKYAASTGFKIPLLVRWKIKSQADLLAPVSPSRLTEEIFKIINSTRSTAIVASMETLGLYRFLQPNASTLMRADRSFRACYMESLRLMDAFAASDKELPSGRLLSFMIRDFLDTVVEWRGDLLEAYRRALSECRAYVLPMNPPRIELENAVRLLFREKGVAVKKARTFEKGQRKEGLPEIQRESTRQEPAAEERTEDGAVKRRKRRRRRRKGASAAADAPQGASPVSPLT
ncbi:MAG TPA: polynucleotide adenylyltransferase PcnB [Treponema sp.]|nr:MAG: polynucleotide adenylyltransferase [Treponema sp. GWC1_61_84]HCM26810.1 polynucleotide adenylyltransferase PcnB [Treponema sp.]